MSDSGLTGKTCLVLEDEFLIALDIEQILEAAGAARVVCFSDAQEALTALRRGARFDLAVLDILLSNATRTSLDVAAALQLQNTPFVFLTGIRNAESEVRQFPMAPVVEKPYRAEELIAAAVRALAAR